MNTNNEILNLKKMFLYIIRLFLAAIFYLVVIASIFIAIICSIVSYPFWLLFNKRSQMHPRKLIPFSLQDIHNFHKYQIH